MAEQEPDDIADALADLALHQAADDSILPRVLSDTLPLHSAHLPAIAALLARAAGPPEDKLHLVRWVRKLLSTELNPPIDAVLEAGVLPHLVGLLAAPAADPVLLFEAAWAVTNVASGNSGHTRALVASGVLAHLVRLLAHPASDVVEQCVWGLGNVAGDSALCRDAVLREGAVPALLRAYYPGLGAGLGEGKRLTALKTVAWTMTNLTRAKPPPALALVAPLLPCLAALAGPAPPPGAALGEDFSAVRADALYGLSYVSEADEAGIAAVLRCPGALDAVLAALRSPDRSLFSPALRCAGNIVIGNEAATQAALDAGLLAAVERLVTHESRSTRKEALWLLSNVCAGARAQVGEVLRQGLLPPIARAMRDAAADVAREASWALANAVSGGGPRVAAAVVECGAVELWAEFLRRAAKEAQAKHVAPALRALLLLLGEGAVAGAGADEVRERLEEAGVGEAAAEALNALQGGGGGEGADVARTLMEELGYIVGSEEEEG